MNFIAENEDYLTSETVRRSTRVFERLSRLLNYKRSADQCRSHHQRMKRMARQDSTESILAYLRSKYEKKSLLEQTKGPQQQGKEGTTGGPP